MTNVYIRTPYSGDRFRVSLACQTESRTHQSFKDECDINHILAGYERTGIITHANPRQGRFEDVTNATSYHDAMNTLLSAQEAFAELPARVRKHFDNDPAEFLAAIDDPARKEELYEIGLLEGEPPARSESPQATRAESAAGEHGSEAPDAADL